MLTVGLTGPTGAGKGEAARAFAAQGFTVVDADAVAHAVMGPGTPCAADVARAFGADILGANGAPDRKALAALVFADAEKLALLNAVTHPHILREIGAKLEWLARQGCPAALLDAPALYESGADKLCGRVVAVTAPAPVRLARVMARDGLGEAAARRRVTAQHEDDFYTARANFTLRNDGALASFAARAAALAAELLAASPKAGGRPCAET